MLTTYVGLFLGLLAIVAVGVRILLGKAWLEVVAFLRRPAKVGRAPAPKATHTPAPQDIEELAEKWRRLREQKP